MVKKTYLLIAGMLCLTGCTREVYLQAVPCCEEKPCPCYTDGLECCPELASQKVTYTFEVEDIPTEPVKPCTKKKNCRTVCREVEVIKPQAEAKEPQVPAPATTETTTD